MKNTLTLFIVFSVSISSLLAQDLNFENIQKEKNTKQNMKFKFGVSPSVSYIPVLPSIGDNYSVTTADYYHSIGSVISTYDSITTLSSNTDISSKFLMNFGISLKYNINKKLFISFNPFFSLYKPKTNTYLNIDDQTNNPFRRQWDTIISMKNSNYLGLPISLGLQLNSKFSIEIGAQYLLSSTTPPSQTRLYTGYYWQQKTMRNLLPISGMLVFDYNISKRITYKFGINFGRSFYFPNTISLEDNIFYYSQDNTLSVYTIHVYAKEKISYCNFTMTTGICFSF